MSAHLEDDLVAHLLADSAITTLVDDRIRPQAAPIGNAKPYIVYTVISGAPENSMDGYTSGVARYRVQFDCYASTQQAVSRLARALRDRLQTAAASFSAVVDNDPLFQTYEDDTRLYRRALEASIRHTES